MNVSRIKRFQRGIGITTGMEFKLEIGCGDKPMKGYLGMDINDFGQGIVWDVEQGIPLPNNSCSHIYASHSFEHLDDLIGVMNECHRVLKAGGELWIIVPHKNNPRANVPTHVRPFTKATFEFFTEQASARDYGAKLWAINELNINKRPDIHVKLSPIKCQA